MTKPHALGSEDSIVRLTELMSRNGPFRFVSESDTKHSGTRLGNEDIDLGAYFSEYQYCSPLMISEKDVQYRAAKQEVWFRALMPNAQGYITVSIPVNINTLEGLLDYLSHSFQCTLKPKPLVNSRHGKAFAGLLKRFFGK